MRFLLEVVDGMVLSEDSNQHSQRRASFLDGSSACGDFQQFFRITQRPLPDGLIDESGRMQRFDDDMVVRHVRSVVVRDDAYVVLFKAGIEVAVAACDGVIGVNIAADNNTAEAGDASNNGAQKGRYFNKGFPQAPQ